MRENKIFLTFLINFVEINYNNNVLGDYSLRINEMNDCNVISGRKKGLRMLRYKVPTLLRKLYNVT